VLAAGPSLKPVHGKNGLEITPTVTFDSLDPDDLFAVVVPGGWAPDKLRRYLAVTQLVSAMDAAGKTLGIICHGGLVAISARIVRGAAPPDRSHQGRPGERRRHLGDLPASARATWSGGAWWPTSRFLPRARNRAGGARVALPHPPRGAGEGGGSPDSRNQARGCAPVLAIGIAEMLHQQFLFHPHPVNQARHEQHQHRAQPGQA